MGHLRRVQDLGTTAVVEIGNASVDPHVRKLLDHTAVEVDQVDLPIENRTVRRRVHRVVEVPYTRKVKVPTTTQKVVQGVRKEIVRSQRPVEVEELKWVDEKYTDVEERKETVMKEIWVKQIVPEEVVKRVPVTKTRRIQVPHKVHKIVEEEHEIEVPTTQIIEVAGYRIDEVTDTKKVEVEGWQEVEYVPRIKGNLHVDAQHELHGSRKMQRKKGLITYDVHDGRMEEVDTDSSDDTQIREVVVGNVRVDGHERRTRPKHHRKLPPSRLVRTFDGSEFRHADFETGSTTYTRPYSSNVPNRPLHSSHGASARAQLGVFNQFGFRLVPVQEGLVIKEVMPGGYAAKAHLVSGDILRNADNRPVNNLADWRAVLAQQKPNTSMKIVVLRQGSPMHMRLYLEGFDPTKYQRLAPVGPYASLNGGALPA